MGAAISESGRYCCKSLFFLVRPGPLIHRHFGLALAWWMQFAGEPANCVRLHGIGRNDLVLYGVALGTFELAMLKNPWDPGQFAQASCATCSANIAGAQLE